MDKKPLIIIVPGWIGSQLNGKLTEPTKMGHFLPKVNEIFHLWVSATIPIFNKKFFLHYMKLIYNKEKCCMEDQNGIEVSAPDIGPTDSIEYLNPNIKSASGYFMKLIDHLSNKFGYIRNKDIFGAPYDFRKIGDSRQMDEYFVRLQNFIENQVNFQARKVMFISHSLGSPLLHHFLNKRDKAWKDLYIDSWYSIAGAFGGAFGITYTILIGSHFFIPHIISLKELADVYLTQPSLLFLMASEEIFDKDRIVVQGKDRVYKISQLREFVGNYLKNGIIETYEYIPEIFIKTNPGVDFSAIYGQNVPTTKLIKYNGEIGKCKPEVISGNGDGSLLFESLNACDLWLKNNVKKFEIVCLEKANHSDILNDKRLFNHLDNFINIKLMN